MFASSEHTLQMSASPEPSVLGFSITMLAMIARSASAFHLCVDENHLDFKCAVFKANLSCRHCVCLPSTIALIFHMRSHSENYCEFPNVLEIIEIPK